MHIHTDLLQKENVESLAELKKISMKLYCKLTIKYNGCNTMHKIWWIRSQFDHQLNIDELLADIHDDEECDYFWETVKPDTHIPEYLHCQFKMVAIDQNICKYLQMPRTITGTERSVVNVTLFITNKQRQNASQQQASLNFGVSFRTPSTSSTVSPKGPPSGWSSANNQSQQQLIPHLSQHVKQQSIPQHVPHHVPQHVQYQQSIPQYIQYQQQQQHHLSQHVQPHHIQPQYQQYQQQHHHLPQYQQYMEPQHVPQQYVEPIQHQFVEDPQQYQQTQNTEIELPLPPKKKKKLKQRRYNFKNKKKKKKQKKKQKKKKTQISKTKEKSEEEKLEQKKRKELKMKIIEIKRKLRAVGPCNWKIPQFVDGLFLHHNFITKQKDQKTKKETIAWCVAREKWLKYIYKKNEKDSANKYFMNSAKYLRFMKYQFGEDNYGENITTSQLVSKLSDNKLTWSMITNGRQSEIGYLKNFTPNYKELFSPELEKSLNLKYKPEPIISTNETLQSTTNNIHGNSNNTNNHNNNNNY